MSKLDHAYPESPDAAAAVPLQVVRVAQLLACRDVPLGKDAHAQLAQHLETMKTPNFDDVLVCGVNQEDVEH